MIPDSNLHQQAINCPAKTGSKGQQVAKGREMEHEMTVEHDDGHTQKGYQRTKCLNARDLLRLAEEQGKEQHGKERTGADDKRGVRRRGERIIFLS